MLGASFMSIMTRHPETNRFAVGAQYGGVLDVMEWKASDFSLRKIGGISQFLPKVTSKDIQGTPNFVPNEDTRWGMYGWIRMQTIFMAFIRVDSSVMEYSF